MAIILLAEESAPSTGGREGAPSRGLVTVHHQIGGIHESTVYIICFYQFLPPLSMIHAFHIYAYIDPQNHPN